MATAVVSVPGLAEAACINTGGSNYECSGALTTPQPFSGAGVAVTTTPGFSVNTTGGVAIDINGTGPLSYTDTNTSNLTGTSGGISIVQTNGPGTVTVLTGGTVTATEAAGTGIHAFGSQSGTGASVNAAAVSGGRIGINVQNIGSGLTQVIASGPVTGSNWYGIVAANNQILLDPSGDFNAAVAYGGTTPTDVIVRASGGVTGGLTGVLAWNGGAGELQVDTRGGAVSGGTRDGIVALSYPFGIGNTPTNLSVTSDAVSGARHGIVAINAGSGENTVTAYGAVSGASGYGIAAVNGAYNARDLINDGVITITGAAGTDLTVTAHGPVSGGLAGIYANNQGTGATQLTAAALVQGGTYGIRAENGEDAGDLKVNVANVTGGTGVSLVSASRTGVINVVASGPVVGTTGDGINTYNRFDIRSLSVTATSVEGARNGITVLSESDTPSAHINGGFITISASGLVKGVAGDGIYADNSATLGAGGGMNIDVAEVSGGRHGILALTNGLVIGNLINGALTITTRGSVTGFSGDGIHAEHAGDAEISINAQAAVSGGVTGIYALHTGAGATTITAGGAVSGGTAAIDAISAGAPIRIDVAGTGSLRNASGALSDLAVRTSGGQANLTNAGLIAGTMNLSGAGNTVGNAGVWATAGTSLFGGATDVVTNQIGGAIVASGMTRFDNLGLIVNQGRITMLNGVTGDVLQTSGNARFDAGSIFAVDIGGANQSDRFVAAGTATLTGGTIAVNVQSPLQAGARYTVLTGNGGVNGQFSALSGGTAFLTLQDSYDANNVYLDVIKYRNFAEAGLTANQIATAGGLESLGAGPLYSAVANLFTDAQARNAFDQLSGEAHASLRTALVEDSRFMRSGAIDRLRGAFDAPGAPVIPVMSYAQGGPVMVRGAPQERFAIWAQAYGSWGHWSGNGNAAKLTRSTGGFTVGIDTLAFADWRIGLLAGYSSTGIGARAASGNSDNYHLGGYAGTQWGPVGVRVGLIETWHDIRATRQVVFPGFSDLLQGSYRGNTTQVFGDIGYRLTYGRMAFEPFANLAYVHLRTDGFREIGGPAALISQGRTMSTTFTTLGLRASMQFDLGGIEVTARGTVGWRHAFGAVTPRALFAFAGGAPFGIDGAAIARNAAVLEAGLDIPLAPRATFGLSYAAQLARRASDQTFKANLAVKF